MTATRIEPKRGPQERAFSGVGGVDEHLVSLVSPYAADREAAADLHRADGLEFIEVFVDAPLELCEERDPKGLYARARAGELEGMTGVGAPYEVPREADLVSVFETGTVRMATLLRGQGDALPAIRRHVAEAAQAYRRGDVIALPTRAWLIAARAG